MEITANDIQKTYNNTFFDEEKKPKSSRVMLLLSGSEGDIVIPAMNIHPDMTIHEIIQSFFDELKENGPIYMDGGIEEQEQEGAEEVSEEIKEDEADPEMVNFELIEYRKNQYFVEQMSDGEFVVRNQKRTKIYQPQTPLARGVIKVYKEKLGL